MMIQYKLQNGKDGNPCAVTIVGQSISIPMDEDNTDYQAYLKFLADGGQPLPADDNGQTA